MPLNCKIPKEAWTGKNVNLNHLRTFGCILYVYVELDYMCKLDPSPRDASSLGTEQANTAIGFGIHKIERCLGIRMWYSMRRRRTRTY